MRRRQGTKVRGVYERDSGSGIWWIIWWDAEGKRRREKVGRKSDAIDLLAIRKADALSGRKLERPLRERPRMFKELANHAILYSRQHKANADDDEWKIGVLVQEFGERPADSLTQQDFTAFLESRETSAATYNRYRACISMIYREAVRAGWTERNPARLIKAKKEENGRIRYLAAEEEVRLREVLSHADPRYLNELEVALNTGMRRGEQFSLTWLQVDFKNRRIHLARTKNGSSRTIPLNSAALAALERQQLISGKSTHVFVTEDGKPFIKRPIRRWFEEALLKAKIDGFRWHDLRHSFCSRLVMAGVHLKTVQELAGHKVLAMTARYAHLSPGHLQDAVELIAGNGHQPGSLHQKEQTATTTATSTKKPPKKGGGRLLGNAVSN